MTTTQSNNRIPDPPDLSIELLLLSFPSPSSLPVLNIKNHTAGVKKKKCLCLGCSVKGSICQLWHVFRRSFRLLQKCHFVGVWLVFISWYYGGVTHLLRLLVQSSLQDAAPGVWEYVGIFVPVHRPPSPYFTSLVQRWCLMSHSHHQATLLCLNMLRQDKQKPYLNQRKTQTHENCRHNEHNQKRKKC